MEVTEGADLLLSSVVNIAVLRSLTAEELSLMGRVCSTRAQSVMQSLRLTQEYKVSSCEQRLINPGTGWSGPPMEESGGEAPCGDRSVGGRSGPFFRGVKLKPLQDL